MPLVHTESARRLWQWMGGRGGQGEDFLPTAGEYFARSRAPVTCEAARMLTDLGAIVRRSAIHRPSLIPATRQLPSPLAICVAPLEGGMGRSRRVRVDVGGEREGGRSGWGRRWSLTV